jgi:hypothetical protein
VDLSEGERRGYQKKTLKCEVRGAERHRGVKREGSVQAKGGFLAADIESKVESGEWRVESSDLVQIMEEKGTITSEESRLYLKWV